MIHGEVKLRTITPGLLAKLIRANEIPQKEAYTRRGSLFMGKLEKNVPKGKNEENSQKVKERFQRKCI